MLVDYWTYFYKNKVLFYLVGACNRYFNGVLKIDSETVWYKKKIQCTVYVYDFYLKNN